MLCDSLWIRVRHYSKCKSIFELKGRNGHFIYTGHRALNANTLCLAPPENRKLIKGGQLKAISAEASKQ